MQKYQSHDKTFLYTTVTVWQNYYLQKNECFVDFRIATPLRTAIRE